MSPFVTPSSHAAVPHAEQRVSAYPQQGQPENSRPPVSLCYEMDRLTLTEPPAPLCKPATATPTTVAPQPPLPACAAPECTALKTALHNLIDNSLSSADFVVLVNRFGYHSPLCRFPLHTLQPSDWLALKERARLRIVLCAGVFFEKIPPQAITCDICLALFVNLGKALFSRVPERLKEPFFNKVAQHYPLAILEMPAAERTFARLLTACCAQPAILDKLSDRERSAALVTGVLQRTGYGLEYIAPEQRSYSRCLQACRKNGRALEYVPEALKNNELCQAALASSPGAYRWLPAELSKSYEWQLLACQKQGAVLQWIPKPQHHKELLEAACRSSAIALAFIDQERITYEMCRLACNNNACFACQYIPQPHLDETIRWLICSATDDPLLCARFSIRTAAFYERLLQHNRNASLSWIPKQYRASAHYLPACHNRGADLALVPEQQRSAQICFAACRNDGTALRWVPEQCRTVKICLAACEQPYLALPYVREGELPIEWFLKQAMYDQAGYSSHLLMHARRLLTDADFQLLLESSVLCDNSTRMTLLTQVQVSCNQKRELLEWILNPRIWPTPAQAKESDLREMASPLTFSLDNPEFRHLRLAAVKAAAHWTPPRYGAGQRLLNKIEQALCSVRVERADHNEALFYAEATTAGGRTLKVAQGAQACYYKFQRREESLKTLMTEGIIHSLRESYPELFGQLNSKLPGQTRFFRLYLDQLPEIVPHFDDPIAITKDEKGQQYLHVYRYMASTEYSIYAHCPDPACPADPYRKGERGILAGCHDIGQFIAMGLVPTSTLPAFHNSTSAREWTALHTLFGKRKRTVHPGTLGGWNGGATEYCDFGYDGFRDVGDFEPFGKIESVLNRTDALWGMQVPEQEQCICLLNAVCENLLAANLIRARLRQTAPDYHYKNPEAQKQNQAFIEKTLLSFLEGMYTGQMEGGCDCNFLRERLELDAPAYKRWLGRAAVEVLYWTAKQPDPEQPDQPPFAQISPDYSHTDGYALHLNRTGRLDPELYPDTSTKEEGPPVYPIHFYNRSEQLNLGSHNAVFPLTTLMRGLVRLCTGILSYDHNL